MTAYLPAKRGNTWVSLFDAHDVLRYVGNVIKHCNLIIAKCNNNMITIRKVFVHDVHFT